MEVCLHVGAHKTATTYLQERLQTNGAVLREHGVFAVPTGYLRRTVTERVGGAVPGRLFAPVGRRRLSSAVDRMIEDAAGPHLERLVLSDENMIGTCAGIVERARFYGTARGRLTALRDALPEPPSTVLLGIRSYAGFLASAWGQRLRAGHFVPFDATLRAALCGLERGWPDLVRDLAAVFPEARLIVWRYEEFAALEPLIVQAMVGAPAARWLSPFHDRPMKGLSARAVAALSARADPSGRIDRQTYREAIRAWPRSPDNPGFDPWSAADRAALDARYARDVARIAEAYPAAILHWPAAA